MLLRKWKVIFLWKKSLLVFWSSPKNESGSNCQKWAKNSLSGKNDILLTWLENQKWFFSQKSNFWSSGQVKKMHILPDCEFLAHFWQYDPDASFGLGQKTKSDFFHKKILSYLVTKSENAIFGWKWVFGPFLAIWPSYIFQTWSENKVIFSQKSHFLFTKRPIFARYHS